MTGSISPEQFGRILDLQQTVFKQVVEGEQHQAVIEFTCRQVEAMIPDAVACYMHLDDNSGQLCMLTSPCMPEECVSLLDELAVHQWMQTCGRSIPLNKPVYVDNLLSENGWRPVLMRYPQLGWRACWSHPVQNAQTHAVGCLSLYISEPRTPSLFHRQLMAVAATLIGFAQVQQARLKSVEFDRQRRIHQLEVDHLTGLPLAAGLNRRAVKSGEHPVLILLNLNNLSYLNNVYGTAFGDEILCSAASRLRQLSVPRADVLRSNADEFALFYRNLPADQIHEEVEALRRHFRQEPFSVGELTLYLSFNIGVGNGRNCYLEAVRALKRSRRKGKNCVHVYDAAAEERDDGRRIDFAYWNLKLHSALASDGVQPWFQGIRDNRTGKVYKWEVLVRLYHDEGIAAPEQFLDVAKRCGLMPAITRQVVERAMQAISGTEHHISLNITEEDLAQGYLPDYLDQCCKRFGVPQQQVTLELLEGVSSGSKQDQAQQLRELKRRGYRLAIDDFGTEYSNFERILELEIDVLKIDAKYIRDIHQDSKSYEIVRAIAFFAANVGIRTVAEYVHCQEVQEVVNALGIDESQGYLFSRPTPALVAVPE